TQGAVKSQEPPTPTTQKAPVKGASINDVLRNQVAYWLDAAGRWDTLGKAHKRQECLAAAEVLQAALSAIDSAETQEELDTELYSTEQAAEYLNISVATVRYHIQRGNLTPMHVGNSFVFSKEQLDDFAASKRKPGRQPKQKEG